MTRQRPVLQSFPQRFSLHVFQHQELRPLTLLEPVDVCDAAVIQRRQQLGFTLEAGQSLWVAGKGFGTSVYTCAVTRL